MKAYLIYCSTGCTCCSYENHYCGPFDSRETAQARAEQFKASARLASQYARNGRYTISEHDAEQLPDGRIIIGCRIFPALLTADDYPEEIRENDFPSGEILTEI